MALLAVLALEQRLAIEVLPLVTTEEWRQIERWRAHHEPRSR
jgi:hypothetical protein